MQTRLKIAGGVLVGLSLAAVAYAGSPLTRMLLSNATGGDGLASSQWVPAAVKLTVQSAPRPETCPDTPIGGATYYVCDSDLVDAGHVNLSSTHSIDGIARSVPDVGAYEYVP